jgi:hypothetical protein
MYSVKLLPCIWRALAFTAYGIHWFAMAHRRYIDSNAEVDGWMAMAFLFLSILGVDVFRRAGDIPVMIVFVGLTLIYAAEIPTSRCATRSGCDLHRTPSVEALSVVELLAVFFPRPCDREVVRHFEYSGDGIGAYAGDVLIGLTVYHAVEGYIAVLHRDADRLCWVNGIFIECRKPVNRPE